MKFLIVNQHTCNYGDDAAGIAVIQQILEGFPEANIDIIYNAHSNDDRNSCIPIDLEKVRHRTDVFMASGFKSGLVRYLVRKIFKINFTQNQEFERYLKIVQSADWVIVSPCGANIGVYRDWQFLTRLLIAVLEKKTPIFHLNTIQKSNSKIFDFVAKFVLKRSKLSVREVRSLREMEGIGLKADYGVDTAFSLSRPNGLPQSFLNPKNKYIAFIPTDLGWHPNFKNEDNLSVVRMISRSLASNAKKNGYQIKIIPHLYGVMDEITFLNDVKRALIDAGVDSSRVTVLETVSSVWDYQEAIEKSSLVVSMRYHGIVFAVKSCVPFVSLAYENKMKEVCMYAATPELYFDLKSFDEQALIDKLDEVCANEADVRARLVFQKPYLVRRSRIVIDEIKILSHF